TLSPSAIPQAARLAALMPTMNRPPVAATRLRQVWPLIVMATFGRLPAPSAVTISAGTSIPVALPAGSTVAGNPTSTLPFQRVYSVTCPGERVPGHRLRPVHREAGVSPAGRLRTPLPADS